MEEIFLKIWDAVGWPASLLVLGVILDYYASKSTKSYLAAFIAGQSVHNDAGRVLKMFNDALLVRLLCRKIFSVKFAFRSAIISAISIALILTILAYKVNLSPDILYSIDRMAGLWFVIVLIITTIFVDILANAATAVVLRLAEASRGVFDVVVVACANVVLTMSIFTWLFPIGVVICLYINVFEHSSVNFQLSVDDFSKSAESIIKYNGSFRVRAISVAALPLNHPKAQDIAVVYSMFLPKSQFDAMSNVSNLIGGDPANSFTFQNSGIVSAALPAGLPSINTLAKLYNAAFYDTDNVKTNLPSFLHLDLFAIRASSIYGLARAGASQEGFAGGRARCKNGAIKSFVAHANSISDMERAAVESCDRQLAGAAMFADAGSFDEALRSIGSAEITVPLAPFFVSTFIISILYYIAIILTYIALSCNMLLAALFRSPVTRRDEIPFTVIGGASFAVVLLISQILHLVSWAAAGP